MNFGRRSSTGEAVELTRELADQLGMMEDEVGLPVAEIESREVRSERLGTKAQGSSLKPP